MPWPKALSCPRRDPGILPFGSMQMIERSAASRFGMMVPTPLPLGVGHDVSGKEALEQSSCASRCAGFQCRLLNLRLELKLGLRASPRIMTEKRGQMVAERDRSHLFPQPDR